MLWVDSHWIPSGTFSKCWEHVRRKCGSSVSPTFDFHVPLFSDALQWGSCKFFFANVGTLNLRDRDQPNSPDTDKSDSLAHSSKRERTCADTVGTVLVPWAGHFEC